MIDVMQGDITQLKVDGIVTYMLVLNVLFGII